MPNVTLHLLLANRVLDAWDGAPADPPFDLERAESRNAFRQGAFGPDIGYFPGADPFLSDLAHYVRSGDLTRALVRKAESERERAYAWGWVTHVLGDAEIHPLVGEAVAHFLHGERGGFVGVSEDRTTHVRVEVGLDAAVSDAHEGLRSWVGRPVFNAATVEYLAAAYRDTYLLDVDPSLFMASHATAVRMANRALATIGTLGSAQAADDVAAVRGARWALEQALAVVREGMDQESMLLAFLNPVPPAPWLAEGVRKAVERFPERFFEVYPDGIARLPNFNLDTGRIEDGESGTPCGRSAAARLEALGGAAFPAAENGRRPAHYPGRTGTSGAA